MTRLARRGALALLVCLPGLALAQGMPPVKPGVVPPAPTPRPHADAARCANTAFEIVNQSGVDVVEIYLRASGQTGNWGEDRLGDRMLRRGQRQRFDPGPGVHDVLMLTADGRAVAAMRQNACSLSVIRLEPDGRLSFT